MTTYLSYAAVFFIGFVTCAMFVSGTRECRCPWAPKELEAAYERLRAGNATDADEQALRDAASFEREGLVCGR